MLTSRAAVLPTLGDPYVAKIWLTSYERFWHNEIDKLYVYVNSGVEDPVFNYTVDLFKAAGAEVITARNLVDHGPALTAMIDQATEENIYIVEEDFYMMSSGNIKQWFEMVEGGVVDAVVSERGCCGTEIIDKLRSTYNIQGKAATQPNFWPSLLVTGRDKLLATDHNFAAKCFPAGEKVIGDWAPTVDTAGDTFVWASIQLRAQNLRFHYENQWRLIDVTSTRPGWVPPWLHFGSTSTTLNGGLLDENMRMLGNRNPNAAPYAHQTVPDEGIRVHFETKMAFWKLLCNRFAIPAGHPAEYFNKVYSDAIDRSVVACGLRVPEIKKDYVSYLNLLSPLL